MKLKPYQVAGIALLVVALILIGLDQRARRANEAPVNSPIKQLRDDSRTTGSETPILTTAPASPR